MGETRSTIIECNVWCVANDQNRDLGLPEGDEWMPFAFDISKVFAVKLCGPNEFVGDDKATIYLIGGEHMTIDITFIEMISLWRKWEKEKSLQP